MSDQFEHQGYEGDGSEPWAPAPPHGHPEEPEPVEGEVLPDGWKKVERAIVPYSPAAGEAVDLSDRPRVAATIRELTDWQAEVLQPLLGQLQAAMIEEADHQGAYTLRFGRLEVKVDGPDVASTEWEDVAGMRRELAAAGLPAERINALAPEVRTFKVNATEANRIAKSPVYGPIIEAHRNRRPRTRRATVRRVRGG